MAGISRRTTFGKTLDLFFKLEKEFPYSTMGRQFKGYHALYLDRNTGHLRLLVWHNGKEWLVGLEPNDFKNLNKLMKDIKKIISK